MTAKLTLSIDSKIIESAKKRSKKKGVSLSRLIENYLREFSSEGRNTKNKESIFDLIGIAGKVPDNLDYDAELFQMLKGKHLK